MHNMACAALSRLGGSSIAEQGDAYGVHATAHLQFEQSYRLISMRSIKHCFVGMCTVQ